MPYAIPIDIVVVGWLSAIYPAYIYIYSPTYKQQQVWWSIHKNENFPHIINRVDAQIQPTTIAIVIWVVLFPIHQED